MHLNTNHIPATIELAPKQAIESEDLPGLLPPGVRVYITDLGNDDLEETVAAARRVRDLGYEPVPHVAARRVTSADALERRMERLTGEAGVRDVLVIGGGLDSPAGPFDSTMALLETGVMERHGIAHLGVAGHPEGSPDFSAGAALDALRLKTAFGTRTGIEVRIVTQFGFDPLAMIAWLRELRSHGVDLPVHIGVAGPATLKTLLRYAAFCGVGASMSFLKRNAMKITALATTQSPEEVVGPLERHWRDGGDTPLVGMHVFPFGGLVKSATWLHERGSWSDVALPDAATG